MEKIRIIIADDHNILQHGLANSLKMEKDFEVAVAGSGTEVIELSDLLHPDLVIMDVSMPGLNGMEATRQILASHPETKIVALSMHTEKVYVDGMINAGASGYVVKSCSFRELLECIRTILSGKKFFCEEIRRVTAMKKNNTGSGPVGSVFSILSLRERQVLQLIAEGNTSREIAEFLDISVKTVGVHRTNLKAKLGIYSVAELTRFAIAQGLTSAVL